MSTYNHIHPYSDSVVASVPISCVSSVNSNVVGFVFVASIPIFFVGQTISNHTCLCLSSYIPHVWLRKVRFWVPKWPQFVETSHFAGSKGGSDLNLLSAEVIADGLASLLSGGSWEVRNDRGACELLGKRWRALLLSKSKISDLRP